MSMQPKEKITVEQALSRCENLCARSEQSSCDIEQRLLKWGLSRCEIEDILQRLVDGGYVDDKRYAHAYVREKYRFAGWGRIKIIYNLRLKHIDNDTIARAMSEIDAEEYREKLERLLRAKYREVCSREPFKARMALMRFAASRGFEGDLSVSVLDGIVNDDVE